MVVLRSKLKCSVKALWFGYATFAFVWSGALRKIMPRRISSPHQKRKTGMKSELFGAHHICSGLDILTRPASSLSLSRPNILSPFWPQQEMKRMMMMMIIMASLTPYAPFNDQCSAPKSDKNSPHWVSNTFCMGYFTTEEDYKTITFKSPTEPIWMIDQSYYYSLETMITWKLIPGGAINKPCW